MTVAGKQTPTPRQQEIGTKALKPIFGIPSEVVAFIYVMVLAASIPILSSMMSATLVKTNEVNWIILDHLSILLSGNESGDERKMIDVTMTKLRSFVEETGIGMILISHLRRAQGDQGHEDGAKVSLGQLRGSHAIAQLSDLVIALQREHRCG